MTLLPENPNSYQGVIFQILDKYHFAILTSGTKEKDKGNSVGSMGWSVIAAPRTIQSHAKFTVSLHQQRRINHLLCGGRCLELELELTRTRTRTSA